MMTIGIVLVSLAIIFRIVKAVGKKIKKEMMKVEKPKQKFPVSKNNYLSIFLIFLAFIFTLGGVMTMPSIPSMINSFEECVAAGNPVMESYPRQCRTQDGKHFVESLSEQEQCEIAGG